MLVDILMLFASAVVGEATSEVRQWAQRKARDKNPEIETALLRAHQNALRQIRTYCQGVPEWEREYLVIVARLDRLGKDGKVILGMVQGGEMPGSEASLAPVAQEAIADRLMQRLSREHHWLREAPPVLVRAFRGLYLPQLVHYFRLEIKQDPEVFRSLIHDMLAQTGQRVAHLDRQLGDIRTRLDEGVDAFLASSRGIDRRFDELITALKPPQSVPADFASYINEKTAEFIGREFVFTAIQNFMQTKSKGYFIVEADPGVGKTALLAQYVRQTGCLAYFNIMSEGRTRADDFLKSVCAQLIQRYDLNYSLPLHPDNARNGNFLSKLLTEVAAKTGRVEIAVDALDEVDLTTQNSPGANVLYLPTTLPDGVYFILTKRPENLPFVVSAPQQVFDLMDEKHREENLRDIQRFIRDRAARATVSQWMEARHVTLADFTAVLTRNSEGNFMYLKYVLDDIEKGDYANLNLATLPQGLQKYYEQHWQRMGMTAKPLPRRKLKIIYLLSKTRKPVSCNLLADFAEEDPLDVQEVLDQWEQFLRVRPLNGDWGYSIYHKSFQDFLFNRRTVQQAGVSLPDIEQAIVDNLWEDLYGEESN